MSESEMNRRYKWRATCLGCGASVGWTTMITAEIVISNHMGGCEHSDGGRELENRAAYAARSGHQ